MNNNYEDLLEIKKEDLKNLPRRKWDEEIVCDSILIVPTEDEHDSGFMCMSFVLINNFTPICIVDCGTDVVHINGVGGYGELDSLAWNRLLKDSLGSPRSDWSIDCLPCGYLRLFSSQKIKVGLGLSDLDIYGKDFYNESKTGN